MTWWGKQQEVDRNYAFYSGLIADRVGNTRPALDARKMDKLSPQQRARAERRAMSYIGKHRDLFAFDGPVWNAKARQEIERRKSSAKERAK